MFIWVATSIIQTRQDIIQKSLSIDFPVILVESRPEGPVALPGVYEQCWGFCCIGNVFHGFHACFMRQTPILLRPVDRSLPPLACVVSSSLPRNSCLVLEFDTAESSSIVSEWGLVCDLNYRSKVGAGTGTGWNSLAGSGTVTGTGWHSY